LLEGGFVGDGDIFVDSLLEPLDFLPLYFALFKLDDFAQLLVDHLFWVRMSYLGFR
jgi:hypothetical protein